MTPPFNLPAPGRRHTLYIDFLSLQSAVFLVNSRLTLFTATHIGFIREELNLPWALLLPKLRSKFAEFLNECSLKRLRILSSSTCVGLRYGHQHGSLEVFPGSVESTGLRLTAPIRLSRLAPDRICLARPPTGLALHFQSEGQSILLRHPIADNATRVVAEC